MNPAISTKVTILNKKYYYCYELNKDTCQVENYTVYYSGEIIANLSTIKISLKFHTSMSLLMLLAQVVEVTAMQFVHLNSIPLANHTKDFKNGANSQLLGAQQQE